MAAPTGPQWKDFFAALSPAGKLHLMAAVFFLFAPQALLYDLSSAVRLPYWQVVLWCVYSGLVAAGWAFAASTTWLVIAAVLPLSFFVPAFWGEGFWDRGDVVSQRGLQALTALLSLVAGYALFIAFIAREGLQGLRQRAEIDLARRIHDALVPDLERDAAGHRVFGVARPATEVGGDLLDFVERPGRLGVYVADVSGHGVGAGVRMAMVKSALRARLRSGDPLDALLSGLNAMHEDLLPIGMFTTFAGLELGADRRASYSLAGHHPLLHWSAETNAMTRRDLEQPPLGVVPDAAFAVVEFAVAPGDLLVLLTDGLTEVFDAKGEEFGLARLEALLREHARRDLAEIHRLCLAAVDRHGRQLDDQTLVLVRVG